MCRRLHRCVCVSAGGDRGRFVINNRTGEIRLTRPVHGQQLMANYTLTVMVTALFPVLCWIESFHLRTDCPNNCLSSNTPNPPYLPDPQVCQVNDGLKYSVASVLIRVLSENMFPPVFNRTTFKGFIIPSSSPASIVSTYGNEVLQVKASDRDFSDVRTPATPPVL